jgi:divalent metal cation (Fe/Co/Zn/Cd) transporter
MLSDVTTSSTTATPNPAALRMALLLALVTIAYNIIEGVVSVWLGLADETLSLFGFGVDSFVEVISGVGILHMVRRMSRTDVAQHDGFEKAALRLTGNCFFVLSAGLTITAVDTLIKHHAPVTTFWGAVIALISIATMAMLIALKLRVGRQLNSPAIIADAHCTRACLLFSVVLLVASGGYEITHIGGLDAIGALVIAGLCIREGVEAMRKAKGQGCTSCGCGKS